MSLPKQQKALLLPGVGAKYELSTRPVPSPGPGQVLIRNTSVALNPVDWMIPIYGVFVADYGWPAVVGQDAVGEIVALGSDVPGWAIGEIVVYQGFWPPDRGCYQQYTVADAVRMARIPKNITNDEAATIPLALGTAACALYTGPDERGLGLVAPWEADGRSKYAGQAALVIGGSSTVGQLAIQVLKLSGFSPIIATASSRNEEHCKRAGATHVVDYHSTPYSELPAKLKELLGGAQLTVAYDAISIAESQKAALAALAPGGGLVVVLKPEVDIKPGEQDADGKTLVQAYGMTNEAFNTSFGERMYGKVTGLLESGDIKPNQVEVLSGGLAGVVGGLERLEARKVSAAKLVFHPQETA